MRSIALAVFVGLGMGATTHAGMMGLGGMHGGGHHGDGPGGGGGFGMFGAYDTDAIQSYFEGKFTDLTTAYDSSLAEIEDYYNTDDYSDLVSDVELLSDRYGFFLDGVERTIDRFDSLLASLNDEVTYFDDLLTEYQANEELSDERLERIESWITTIQDMLDLKLDIITEKQSVLTENYATYTAFGDEIDSYLDSIMTAGGGSLDTDGTTTAATMIAATAPLYAAVHAGAVCEGVSSATRVVPEPQGMALLLLGCLGLMSRRLHRVVF